ncbi:MAG: pentapeptide repeat-containing protein [Pyrinomonadaceae bacterium]
MPLSVKDQWKEINASARHWETLVFETAKAYFSIVALALGGAGAAIAWTTVPSGVQKKAVIVFLVATIIISALALLALRSQKAYLSGFYSLRKTLEDNPGAGNQRMKLKNTAPGSGYTMVALWGGFLVAIALAFVLLLLLPEPTRIPLLQGANLTGADLSATRSTHADLQGACTNGGTTLPKNVSLDRCR